MVMNTQNRNGNSFSQYSLKRNRLIRITKITKKQI